MGWQSLDIVLSLISGSFPGITTVSSGRAAFDGAGVQAVNPVCDCKLGSSSPTRSFITSSSSSTMPLTQMPMRVFVSFRFADFVRCVRGTPLVSQSPLGGWAGETGEPLIAESISSFGDVAISSSNAVILIVGALGTKFKTVPRGFCGF